MIEFIKNYIEGFYNVNKSGRKFYPKEFNSNIAYFNLLVFGLTSIFMFFYYPPLAYLFFIIILTSTEADANITNNVNCINIIRKLDMLVILIIILILIQKTKFITVFLLIPLVIVHHWKRMVDNYQDAEIRMNMWHASACIISILAILLNEM